MGSCTLDQSEALKAVGLEEQAMSQENVGGALGADDGPIEIASYEPSWPDAYTAERERLCGTRSWPGDQPYRLHRDSGARGEARHRHDRCGR